MLAWEKETDMNTRRQTTIALISHITVYYLFKLRMRSTRNAATGESSFVQFCFVLDVY